MAVEKIPVVPVVLRKNSKKVSILWPGQDFNLFHANLQQHAQRLGQRTVAQLGIANCVADERL